MHYSNNRNANTAINLFKGFKGYLQTDGYRGYEKIVKQEKITHLACWAHARRKFASLLGTR